VISTVLSELLGGDGTVWSCDQRRYFDLIHESRRSNHDAHGLARSSLYASLARQVWFLQPPNGVCINYTSAGFQ
jgi:hypothetical protein